MCLTGTNESWQSPLQNLQHLSGESEQYLCSVSLGVLRKELLETRIESSHRNNSSWHTLFTVALAEDRNP